VVAYVIIPGINGSDQQHWQSLWEQRWDTSAVRIAPASWSAPDLDDWVSAVQSAYDIASGRDNRVFLVAHSLGCWAASAWLSKIQPGQLGGALLVAPPDLQGPAFPRAAAPTFTELSAEPLPCPAILVGSSDDPYCDEDKAAALAAQWRARWHPAGACGHINSASGLGAWPLGQELLGSLTES